MTQPELQAQSTEWLLKAYSWDHQSNVRAEIQRREVFTAEQWARIDEREIQIGDPYDLLVVAWGDPYVVSREQSALGEWLLCKYGQTYVSVRNGKVSSVNEYRF